MIKKLFCTRDTAAQLYYPPMAKTTEQEAVRDFANIAKSPNNPISQNPEDWDLFYIGEYDDNAGKMIPLDTPRHIAKAIDVLQPKQ